MFQKFNIFLNLPLIFFFIIFFFNGSYASEVRVNTIGMAGIVPDEETDLDYNPANINYIDGARIYTGVNYNYVKDEDTDLSSSATKTGVNSTMQDVSPYIQYAHSYSNYINFAIKYNPNFFRYNYEYNFDPDVSSPNDKTINENKIKIDSVRKGRLIYGLSLLSGLKFGISSSIEMFDFKIDDETKYEDLSINSKSKSRGERVSYSGQLGFIFDFGSGNKYGITFGSSNIKGNYKDYWDSNTSCYHSKEDLESNILNVALMPEIKLNTQILLRIFFFFQYEVEDISYWYEETLNRSKNEYEFYSLSDIIGICLVYRPNVGTLWSFSVKSSGDMFSNNSYNENIYASTSDFYDQIEIESKDQTVDLRIGLEKEVISDSLILRCCISPFNISYYKYCRDTKDQDGTFRQRSEEKNVIYNGPVHSFSLGLGYVANENLLVDFNFSQVLSGCEKYRYSNYIYSQDVRKHNFNTKNFNLNFAVTFKF